MILVALLGCGLLGSQGRRPTHELPEGGDEVMVIVAARDLQRGVPITDEDLIGLTIQPGYLPAGIFLNPEHVVGQRPTTPIYVNELIRAEQLMNPELPGLANRIPPRMRVVDLPVSDGAPPVGSYVDLWVEQRGRSCALVQASFVMGHDGEPADRTSPTTYQVLVTPQQALALGTATSPSFTVRASDDGALKEEIACSP